MFHCFYCKVPSIDDGNFKKKNGLQSIPATARHRLYGNLKNNHAMPAGQQKNS